MKLHLIYQRVILLVVVINFSVAVATCAGEGKAGNDLTVSAGKEVSIEYTIRLHDRSVVYTNADKEPLTYVYGGDQIVERLQKDMEGMKAGDDKLVIIHPGDGYGLANEGNIVEIDRSELPENALKKGAHVRSVDENGQEVLATVKEVRESTVLLEMDSPLKGETLYINIKVLNIKETQ